MTGRSKTGNGQSHSRSGFFAPVFWIAVLIGSYFVIADWEALPRVVSSALSLVH